MLVLSRFYAPPIWPVEVTLPFESHQKALSYPVSTTATLARRLDSCDLASLHFDHATPSFLSNYGTVNTLTDGHLASD